MQQICGRESRNKKQDKKAGNNYEVQLGCFIKYNKAMEFQIYLSFHGIKTDITKNENQFCVRTQAVDSLDAAVFYENYLKHQGFDTMLIS